jgi:hypothetical protein
MASVASALVHETSGVGIFGVGDSRVRNVGRVQFEKFDYVGVGVHRGIQRYRTCRQTLNGRGYLGGGKGEYDTGLVTRNTHK